MRILMEENFICLLSQIPDTEQRIKDLSYKQPASCRVRPTASSITMPITKYYYPDANLELTAKYNDNKSLTRGG